MPAHLGRQVGELLEAAVGSRQIPGAVAAAGRGREVLGRWVTGWADTTPGAMRPMEEATVFDLASLTKVVATTTVTLALAGAGTLGLDDPVADHLPAFPACRDGGVTVRHLPAIPGRRSLARCSARRWRPRPERRSPTPTSASWPWPR